LRLTFQRFLKEMARRGMTGGRLLEVGCAYGFFLEEARGFFEYRAGTDYSPAALAKAAGRADRTFLGGVEPVPAEERFDCAACIHVIEHIYEPVGFVESLLARLKPGGWVVLATPDMGSFWRPLLGRRWPFFKVPEHVTYYDRGSLERLLRAAGCSEVSFLPYVSVFSLEMIGEKLGWRPPARLRDLRVWLPATTIAAAGRKG
jgi:SAM-dependent methyltransferase